VATQDRRAELASALDGLRKRIARAAEAAGRDPAEITLIAITKTFPVSDVAVLLELGVRDIGENRDKEARVKSAALPEARWHFVGRLQRNKCRSAAGYASVVHSVDRIELVDALAAGVTRAGRDPLDALVQISLDGDPARGGAYGPAVGQVADAIAGSPGLRLAGVMAVAPLGADPDGAFAILARQSEELRRNHPDADWISAGMSEDLESAIAHGATHLRVGSALLGRREPVLG
jgi:pyridoxal phosphate enzyme (YggS family)